MVQESPVNDGADEQMLGAADKKVAGKREEVKFIKGDQQNGDAKIDIGTTNGKTFTGMTKEELMKYANDPFWVRLRWIFFIGFWAIWVGMLVGAILIIVDAPKCSAPETLSWYKRGLLVDFKGSDVNADDVATAQKLQATGVIYELPPELTYAVKEPAVEEIIKNLVAAYENSEAKVIIDLTANYVPKDSKLMKAALADKSKRTAFIWVENGEVPNNWLSIVNGSAWAEVEPGNFVLSQFGDGLYDLHMNDSIVKQELSDVLQHLLHLGVKGVRLHNTKYFILSKTLTNEMPSDNPSYIHTQYNFWDHSQTTFQEGLGDFLYELRSVVKNVSADAFLSVDDDMVRPEAYQTSSGECSIDIPIYGRFTQTLNAPHGRNLYHELKRVLYAVCNDTWLQWRFDDVTGMKDVSASASVLFVSLLPGVPVVPMDSHVSTNVSEATYLQIEQLRLSPSYMHGAFELQESNGLIAYSRIKSGNPGYFVVLNPTDEIRKGNFTHFGLPDKMTVGALSDNYNISEITVKSKVNTDSFEVAPYATIILTYVPVKAA